MAAYNRRFGSRIYTLCGHDETKSDAAKIASSEKRNGALVRVVKEQATGKYSVYRIKRIDNKKRYTFVGGDSWIV